MGPCSIGLLKIPRMLTGSNFSNLQWYLQYCQVSFNILRLRKNGCYSADDIFKCIFLNEEEWISIMITLKYIPKGPINNKPALV